jgi:integrase
VSLYKRGEVYWASVWIDGVRHLRSLETSNRRQAETLEQRWRDELHLKRFQLPNLNPEMLFGELFARFIAEAEVKPHHTERAKYFLGFFAELAIGQITKNDVVRYRKLRHDDYRRRHPEDKKSLSEATVNRDIEVVRHILYWAADEGLIPANPIARVRMGRERRTRRPVMPVSEEVKLLAACSPHLRAIAIAALDTGMRRGELLSQEWEHVDFDRKVISVTRSKTPEGEHRLIPMTSRLHAMLAEMRQPTGMIFTYKDGPLRRIKTGWKGALRRAGIPHYRFHDLRHTFNSRLADLGIIADIRKELMGHSGGGDVNSLYTHIELPTLRATIQQLGAWHEEKVRTLQAPGEADSPPLESNQTTQTEQQTDDRKHLSTPAA